MNRWLSKGLDHLGTALLVSLLAVACTPEGGNGSPAGLHGAAVEARTRLASDPTPETALAVVASLRAAAERERAGAVSSDGELAMLDAELAARLDAVAERLRMDWAADGSHDDGRSLDEVACEVAGELAEAKLLARLGRARPEAPALDASDPLARAGLPKASAALAAIGSLHETRDAAAIAADETVRAALACAHAFSADGVREWTGPQLAAALASAPWPPANASSGSPPASRMAADLARRLRARAVGEVRTRYAAELRATLESRTPVLLGALRAARDGDLAGVSAVDAEALQREVRALLDRGGALDLLRGPYGGDAWLRGAPDESACDACELDRFFTDLQALACGEGRTAEEGELTVTLVSGAQPPDSLWNQREAAFMTLMLHDRRVQRPSIDWRSHSVSYTWTFQDVHGKHFNLWWSPNMQAERGKDGPYLKVPGTLAPLLLAWLGRREGDQWRIDVQPKRAQHRAELVLTFGKPVPELPRALP